MKPSNYDYFPLGTLIASVLEYDEFCQVTGDPHTINYKNRPICSETVAPFSVRSWKRPVFPMHPICLDST